MNDMMLTDAHHRDWVSQFTYHLDIVPPLIDAIVDETLPKIPVGLGSRFDKEQITGGGYRDNMQILDRFEVHARGDVGGALLPTGAAVDARELWDWVIGYTSGVFHWITPDRALPALPARVNADPLTARGEALVIVGWLIDHADQIATVTELDEHRAEMFTLIRRLRGQYGVFNHPRRARPTLCTVCGERKVIVDWLDGDNGSPKPVRGGKCLNCGEQYRAATP